MKEYFNYHKHSYLSNIAISDSANSPERYVTRALELGHTKLSSCEHGTPYMWNRHYLLAQKHGLKYVHVGEYYIVRDRKERDNSNYHIVIIAKTKNAMNKMNLITSLSHNEESFYYRFRIDLELLKLLPKGEYVVTSACSGGILKDGYNDFVKEVVEICGVDNFYLEIQAHNDPNEIEHSKLVKSLHDEYGYKLIAGCDSHYVEQKDSEERDLLVNYKKSEDSTESNWYMDYPDYDTLVNRFVEQGVFEYEKIVEAIENTMIETEDIKLNTKLRIPSIYKDKTMAEKMNILKDIVHSQWVEYSKGVPKDKHKLYEEELIKEYNIIEQTDIVDYFLFNHSAIKEGLKLGGHLTKSGRGSASSFLTNLMLGFTTVDRLDSKVPMLLDRFIGIDRIKENNSCADKFCPPFMAT